MEEKTLWGITKTSNLHDGYWQKNWLNKSRDLWVHESAKAPLAVFDNRGDARRALNKKLSYEITNWGLDHVHRWAYKTERIK